MLIPRCNFTARPEAGGGNFNFSGAVITSPDDERVAKTIASATREKCNDSQQCRMQIGPRCDIGGGRTGRGRNASRTANTERQLSVNLWKI